MTKEQEAQQAQTIAKRPKMRSEELETPKSRAVFYSILWPSMRKAAIDLGWALALHGSLENDMDIMGMPWTKDCKSHQELAKAISDCLGDTIWREHHLTPHYTKPHGRIVYTLSIGGSWHVDLSIMPPPQEIVDSQAQKIAEQAKEIERMKDCMFHHMDSDTYNHCQEYLEKMRGKNENKTANEIDDV